MIAFVDSDLLSDASVHCSEGILFEGVYISPKISPWAPHHPKVPPDLNYWRIFESEVAKSIYGAWRLHTLTAIRWATPRFTAARGFRSRVFTRTVDRLVCLCYHWPSIIMRHNFLCHNCFRRWHTFLSPYSFGFCFGVLPATKVALRRWLSSSLGATWVLFIMATRARENGQWACVPLLSLALYHHETQFFVSQLFQALTHFSVSIFF